MHYVLYQIYAGNMIGRLIEPVDLAKAVDLYQKAASVFEVRETIKCLSKTFHYWVY